MRGMRSGWLFAGGLAVIAACQANGASGPGVSAEAPVELEADLLIVATPATHAMAGAFTGFLERKSVRYLQLEPESSGPYLEAEYIAVIAGVDEGNGVRALIAKVLQDEEELAWLAEPGNGAIYIRDDSFAEGQKVMLIAGSSPAVAVEGLDYYRDQWLAPLATWLDIKLTREEIYSY